MNIEGFVLKFNYFQDCECSDEKVTPEEFALCVTETTCRLDCQRRSFGSGRCNGWSCECLSQNDIDTEADTEEFSHSIAQIHI